MKTEIKVGKLILTRRSHNDHPPYIFEFIDADGNKRTIVDEDRNVQRLVEAAEE